MAFNLNVISETRTSTVPEAPMPPSQIWISYIKNGNSYIDKQLKLPTTEQQVRALQKYINYHFTSSERFVVKWVFCQRPIVLIGEFHTAALDITEASQLPREVQFDSLTKHQVLSAGFMRPETLQEHGRLFHETTDFDTNPTNGTPGRKVLCIGYAVDKRLLCWPLIFTILVASSAAIATGVITCNVSTGAEVGSFVGAVFSISWAYILWMAD